MVSIPKIVYNAIFDQLFRQISIFFEKWSKIPKKYVMVVKSTISLWVFILWQDLKCMLELTIPSQSFMKKIWSWTTSIPNIDDIYTQFQVIFCQFFVHFVRWRHDAVLKHVKLSNFNIFLSNIRTKLIHFASC